MERLYFNWRGMFCYSSKCLFAVLEAFSNREKYRNPDGTPYQMPLSQPSSATTPFLRSLCFLLALDHTTILSPPLSTTLLHISCNLFDSDTAKLPEIMREDLSPTSPEWLENWKGLLESPLAMNSRRVMTRNAVMRVLESTYDNVKDLRG